MSRWTKENYEELHEEWLIQEKVKAMRKSVKKIERRSKKKGAYFDPDEDWDARRRTPNGKVLEVPEE